MIRFAQDENLGKVVDMKATKVWCFGVDPIHSMYDLRFAAGANKFSQLCAFKFKSLNTQNPYPYFSIAFVCKVRSRMYHQAQKNPSQWFIFKQIGAAQIDVLDKQACFVNYGFDVDKFFQSDIFKLMLPKIESAIRKGLDAIPAFTQTLTNSKDKDEAEKLSTAISDSLLLLKVPNVNDKFYSLKIHELAHEAELDEKIEHELKKKGIYVSLESEEPEQAVNETSFNFDRYDWADGSITGTGLLNLCTDTMKYNATNPVVIMDRNGPKFYNIVDAHIAPGDAGLVLQIDTRKEIPVKL